METLLGEITKLERVKAVGLPVNLFEGVSEKIVAGWRARAMKMYPSDFATAEPPVRLTLLAALRHTRKTEMIDGLVELLIQMVHKINVRAENKVEKEINAEFRRVHGKNGILVRLAAAAIALPDEVVRKAIYPVVGQRTLNDIIAEAKANEAAPVSLSSPIDVAFGELSESVADDEAARVCLVEWWSRVPDPRSLLGRWHRLEFVLGVAVCAYTAAGHEPADTVGEWATGWDQATLTALGGRRDPFTRRIRPSSARTIARVLETVHAQAFNAVLYGYLAASWPDMEQAGEDSAVGVGEGGLADLALQDQ